MYEKYYGNKNIITSPLIPLNFIQRAQEVNATDKQSHQFILRVSWQVLCFMEFISEIREIYGKISSYTVYDLSTSAYNY